MTPEQAVSLANLYLPNLQNEFKTTCRVLAAVPSNKGDYRPHPNSRTARELAWHIAASDVWFLDSLVKGNFEMEEEKMPSEIKSSADVVSWYEKHFPESLGKVSKLDAASLAAPISFFGKFNHPAVIYLQFLLSHSIHNRGQLCAYLRPMGAKVPNIYGGSFDEPMDFAAQA